MNLDEQQTAAVHTESKKALVLAGAGSGKTRVVVERIAYLVEEKKVSPYEILALTFTRKAAGELRARIEERIGTRVHHIAIGTIHGIALKLLHRFGDLIGMRPKNITVYGEFEEDYLIREIALDLGILKGKVWKPAKKEINAMLNAYYSKGEEPKEEHPAYGLFRELLARCKENNAYTYGMLLTAMMQLVPKITQYLKWKHVFLDEAQDTDPLQWWIVEEFPRLLGASLFAVGDIDQSIYRFRGAVPEYLVKAQDQFDIYRLETNYRSMPEIVEASNRLIEHNTERIPKTMRAHRTGGQARVIVEKGFDSQAIVDLLDYNKTVFWMDTGPVCILARVHALLDKVDRLMTEKEIPHIKIGRKLALTNSEEFRRVHSFLKLLVNPYDNFSFLLIRDLIGLSREDYNRIRLFSAQQSKSHFVVWLSSFSNETLFRFFIDHQWSKELPSNFLSAVNDLRERLWHESEIYDFIYAWMDKNPNGSLSEYLDWLAIYDVQDEIEEEDNQNRVQLMTIHAAKGLEFPTVIVAGCNEGILPSKQAINSGDIEEERRLMYVAMTRAKDQLILAVRPELSEGENGRTYESPVSRFVGEIDN